MQHDTQLQGAFIVEDNGGFGRREAYHYTRNDFATARAAAWEDLKEREKNGLNAVLYHDTRTLLYSTMRDEFQCVVK